MKWDMNFLIEELCHVQSDDDASATFRGKTVQLARMSK